jgi:hypothetical protein
MQQTKGMTALIAVESGETATDALCIECKQTPNIAQVPLLQADSQLAQVPLLQAICLRSLSK